MTCPMCGNKWLSYSMTAVIGYRDDFVQASCKCGWKSRNSNGEHMIVQSQPVHPTMPGASVVRVIEDKIGKAEAAMDEYAKSVNQEPDEHFDKCECYPERARRCDYCNEHNCCS